MRFGVIVLSLLVAMTGSALAAKAKLPGDALGFVGSAACQKCHSTEHASWKDSYHSKMVRPRDEAILKQAVQTWNNGGPATGNVSKTPFSILDVKYVVGSFWKQRFLVVNPATGNLQFMDKQLNRMSGQWEPYGQKNDWETMCGTCHTTGWRVVEMNEKHAVTKAAYSEMNIGCESCHGAGAKHVVSKKKKDIFTFTGKSNAEKSRVCGYCHIRLDNEHFRSAQGNTSEHLPHPEVGKSWHPSEDWTKWMPEHVILPGVHAEDPLDKAYEGDLKGMFKLDNATKAMGTYDAGKHHQQYQEFLQSKHYQKDVLSCVDCHSGHATKKAAAKDPKATCATCHGSEYDYKKIMPGTGSTAKGLFVRTHTFNSKQNRPEVQTATGQPEYYFSK